MRRIALVLLALAACSDDPAPERKAQPPNADPGPDAAPRPKSAVTLAEAAPDLTIPVTATALVVVRLGGATILVPHPTMGDVALATLDLGAPTPLGDLAKMLPELQVELVIERDTASGTPPRDPAVDPCALEEGVYGVPRELMPETPPIGDGTGWGTIGTGRYGTIGHGSGRRRAGNLGTRLGVGTCNERTPLVLADARLPARELVEILTALGEATLGVTVDGGATARTLPIRFQHLAGDAPPEADAIELGFTVRPGGVTGAAYKGATADDATWSWKGDLTGLAAAYHQGQAVDALLGQSFVRLRLDGDVTAGDLVTAIANLLAGNVESIGIGEPRDYVYGYGAGTGNSGPSTGRHGPNVSLRIGPSTIDGAYDKNTARRYIKRRLAHLSYCYEKRLLAQPGLAGTVETEFTIDAGGRVSAVSASGVHEEVSSCIRGVIESIEFPVSKVKDGRPSKVTYAFIFSASSK